MLQYNVHLISICVLLIEILLVLDIDIKSYQSYLQYVEY